MKATITMAAAAALAGAMAFACGPSQPGAIGPDGFRHATYPYAVLQTPGTALLSEDWLLANYVQEGSFIAQQRAHEYLTTYTFAETAESAYRYDLFFVNERTSSVMFVRTVPFFDAAAHEDLRLMAHRYADDLAQGSKHATFRHERGHPAHGLPVGERPVRFRVRLESAGPSRLAGVPAFEATVAAEHALLPVGPLSLMARTRVVFCWPGFTQVRRRGRTRDGHPVLLIAGFEAAPEHFDEDVVDYMRLLDAIAIGVSRGYVPPRAPESVAAP